MPAIRPSIFDSLLFKERQILVSYKKPLFATLGWVFLSIPLTLVGCFSSDQSDSNSELIKFLDSAPSNTTDDEEFGQLIFQDLEGKDHLLADYSPGKSIVLVITRGNTGSICPYCSTQVARLIRDYQQISKLNAEVVVVYPVEDLDDGPLLEKFLNRSRQTLNDAKREIPFPVVLDARLVNVDKLGIRKDLSKPATYIVDPAGRVRYAYVGESLADRPSVAAIVAELKKLTK